MGYLTNFMVYTFAMVGVIALTLVIFKYSTGFKTRKAGGASGLRVADTLSLSSRKTLYVVETNGERFLIAGDIDRTTLISKLNANGTEISESGYKNSSVASKINREYSNNNNLGIFATQKSPYDSMVKNMAEKLRR